MARSIEQLQWISGSRRAWLPNLVLLAALVVTLAFSLYSLDQSENEDDLRFENATSELYASIDSILDVNAAVVRGARAFVASTDGLTRDRWSSFVKSFRLDENYPGLQAVGYAARVTPDRVPGILALGRREWSPDFQIWPNGEGGEATSAILYVEPLSPLNRQILGFDLGSEPVRRAAMERAVEVGESSASGIVTLMNADASLRTPGFLVVAAVFRSGAPVETPAQRRDALVGYVYSPFRAKVLFDAVYDAHPTPMIDFSVYDGSDPDAGALLYASNTAPSDLAPRYRSVRTKEAFGRPWTIVTTTTPAFERASSRPFARYAFGIGLVISLLFFLITRSQVNARLRAEETAAELGESERALRSSENRLRRLVDSNMVGIVMFADDGSVREANDAFLEMIGYDRDELAAGSISIARITPPDRAPVDESVFDELRETGAKSPFESVYLRRDGERVPVLQGLAYLGGDDDVAVGFVVDQTERKRADRERAQLLVRERRAREMAEEANRLKDEFLTTVSHELRTPLNAILGWSRLLRTHDFDRERIVQALETIERNARAQAQLVEDLLDVSRIVAGKLRMRVQPVEMQAVVEGALEAIHPAAAAKGVRLESDFGELIGTVSGDATRLQQVVWNLLANAVKFTPKGGTVRVSLGAADGDAVLTVADTGAGIKEEFLPFVFDRFRQEDSSLTRSHGGLGLGLTIVRRLVEMHGGTVAVASGGVDRGATFTVRLPLAGFSLVLEARGGSERKRGAGLDGLKILVVDDDPDTRDVLAVILEHWGAQVLTCVNVAQALDSIEVWTPDVLISDIAMPDGDGYSLIRKVRSVGGESSRIPAVAISAYTRESDRRESRVAGFDEHVAKPVDPTYLVETIERVVARRARFK